MHSSRDNIMKNKRTIYSLRFKLLWEIVFPVNFIFLCYITLLFILRCLNLRNFRIVHVSKVYENGLVKCIMRDIVKCDRLKPILLLNFILY